MGVSGHQIHTSAPVIYSAREKRTGAPRPSRFTRATPRRPRRATRAPAPSRSSPACPTPVARASAEPPDAWDRSTASARASTWAPPRLDSAWIPCAARPGPSGAPAPARVSRTPRFRCPDRAPASRRSCPRSNRPRSGTPARTRRAVDRRTC